ncbi:exosome complex component RRP40 [Culicoides brevitarsis]|uniref:exosome complex component RRP40 n=1 Tax=Culicoides brevitarsis TaxID=469753 RepID=UPI00307B6FEA
MEVDVKSPQIVMPGDRIPEAEELNKNKRKLVLGPGLTTCGTEIRATRAGILQKKPPATFFVDTFQKRYVPIRGDHVIGIVIAKLGDFYRVDIGASEPASMSYLAFEGATKKNRPDVNVDDAIFGRLVVANRDTEAEIVCVDSHGKKGKLGVLNNGFLFDVSINLVRKILRPDCPLMAALAKELKFQAVFGMNGKIWIHANSQKETIAVGNAICAAEHLSNAEIVKMCDDIGQILAGFR